MRPAVYTEPAPEENGGPKAMPVAHVFAALSYRILNSRGEVLKEVDARQWAQYGLEDIPIDRPPAGAERT